MARIRVTYRNTDTVDELVLGAFAQIAAKRRFGLDVVKSDDPEVVYFGAFVELVGPAKAKDPDAFDEWLVTVADLEIVGAEEPDPANPPPAETPSSDTSPESPPTSE